MDCHTIRLNQHGHRPDTAAQTEVWEHRSTGGRLPLLVQIEIFIVFK